MKHIYFPLSLSAFNVILLLLAYAVQLLAVFASHVLLLVFTYCPVFNHASASQIVAFTVLLAAHAAHAFVILIVGFVLSILITLVLFTVSVFPNQSLL